MKLNLGCLGLSLLMFFTLSAQELDSILNVKMEEWHEFAAKGNTNGYFGFMDSSFIYLGTDIKERWTKTEFLTFCEPHFAKGKGWDFKASSRHWYFHDSTAWFEEYLNTWMGPIRASGIAVLKNGEWKLSQYNLTLTVDNDKIDSYLKINLPK